MNDMIERYLYDVTRRLPEAERGEVRRELEASITDMLPDNANEQDVTDVLTKLGAPRILAEQYRQKPRYLISPAQYDTYITALKSITLIVALVCACASGLSAILSVSDPAQIGELIGTFISSGIEGALQAALWVTLFFIIADRTGANTNRSWTVKDLPRIPNTDGVRISRPGTMVGMALTVFFTSAIVMMILRGEWSFMLVRGAEVVNPFTQAALNRSIPYIVLLGVLSFIVNGAKYFYGRWNVPLFVANAVYNLIWVSTVIYMLNWPDLFSNEFIVFVGSTFTAEADILTYLPSGGAVSVISSVLIFIIVIETAVTGWHTWKGMRQAG